MLWRSIEHIPALYREPLVLFYREHQSIEQVAAGLDLTKDAVKQRLSRGRTMLQDQMAAFVEGALTSTGPGRAFTLGVLAALPILTTGATAATLGMATAKTVATVKGAAVISIITAIIGPILGILGAWHGTKASLERVQSERERRYVIRQIWIVTAFVLCFGLALGAVIMLGYGSWTEHPVFLTWCIVGLCLAYLVWMSVMIFHGQRTIARIRAEEAERSGFAPRPVAPTTSPEPIEFRSAATLLGLPLIHVRLGNRGGQLPRPALGWIAIGDVAVGVLFGAGGVSVGAISLGGGAIGLLALGGAGIGLFAMAGMAIGVWAIGGLAVGYLACGGAALGWLAAAGGSAVARAYAIGGVAVAQHANDSIAREFIRTDAFLGGAQAMLQSGWFQVACWLPMLLVAWQLWRMRNARQTTS
ncbi:MAG TPA: sigma-70 family RNA polymerase sigma factor [Candidatus Paceibacterota bacterium]|nr:sigma-70 family RNA polymerase sigma factor [Candidatus Paceibacterota bacterium]